MSDLRPSSQWIVPAGTSTGATIRQLYLVESSPNVWELDDEGPAEGVFVETSTNVFEIDDDPDADGGMRIIQQMGSGVIYLQHPTTMAVITTGVLKLPGIEVSGGAVKLGRDTTNNLDGIELDLDGTLGADTTSMTLLVRTGSVGYAEKLVQVGGADSGGSGFRYLRVTN